MPLYAGLGPGVAPNGTPGPNDISLGPRFPALSALDFADGYTGGGIRTVAPGGGDWSSPSTWVEGSVPTARNDVRWTPSSGSLTISTNVVCRTISDAGNKKFVTVSNPVSMTVGSTDESGTVLNIGAWVGSSNLTVNLVSTSNSLLTLAGNEASAAAIVINATASYVIGVPSGFFVSPVTLTAGSLIASADGNTEFGSFTSTGAGVRTLDAAGGLTVNGSWVTGGSNFSFINSGAGLVSFTASNSVAFTITSGGWVFPGAVTILNGSGPAATTDALVVTGTLTVSGSGTPLQTNGNPVTAAAIVVSTANALVLGTSTVTLTGTGTVLNTTAGGLDAPGATFNVTGSGASMALTKGSGASDVLGTVNWTGGGAMAITGAALIGALAVTGASNTDSFAVPTLGLVVGSLTLLGVAANSHLLFQCSTSLATETVASTVVGQQGGFGTVVKRSGGPPGRVSPAGRFATPAASTDTTPLTVANVDFLGITLANFAVVSAQSVGDCGGNTLPANMVDPSLTNYWVDNGGNGNVSDVSHWASTTGGVGGTGRVPLPQDTAVVDDNGITATGRTITMDMPRGPGNNPATSIGWTLSSTQQPTLTSTISIALFGAIANLSGVTQTINNTASLTLLSWTLGAARIAAGAGITFGSGTVNLRDLSRGVTQALLTGTTATFGGLFQILNPTTFTSTVPTLTCATFAAQTTTGTCTLQSGSSLTLTGTGTVLNNSGGGLSAAGVDVTLTDTSGVAKTYTSGISIRSLSFTAAGTGGLTMPAITVAGSIVVTGNRTVTVNKTATVTCSSFYLAGAPSALATLNSSSAGNRGSINASQSCVAYWANIQDSNASGARGNAYNSTLVSDDLNWQVNPPTVVPILPQSPGRVVPGTRFPPFVSGQPAVINVTVAAPLGTASAVGFDPTFTETNSPPAGTATASGFGPTETVEVDPTLGTASAVGFAPSLTETDSAPLGTATASGFGPAVTVEVDPTLGTASASGFAPSPAVEVDAPLGTATAVGTAPTIVSYAPAVRFYPPGRVAPGTRFPSFIPGEQRTVTVSAPLGTAAAVGFAPSLTEQVGPTLGTATASGFGPSLTVEVDTTLGVVSASGFSPSLTETVSAPLGTASAVGFGPGEPVTVSAPLGTAIASGLSPTSTVTVTVPLGTASSSGFSPIPTVQINAPVGTAAALGFVPRQTVPLGLASAVGFGPTPTITVSAPLGTATAVGIAPRPSPPLGLASAVGFAPGLTVTVRLDAYQASGAWGTASWGGTAWGGQHRSGTLGVATAVGFAPHVFAGPVGPGLWITGPLTDPWTLGILTDPWTLGPLTDPDTIGPLLGLGP